MKVIIPVAGKGTRLLPITKYVPKPLLRVAGRPVLDYVMDRISELDVEELIFITGHLKELVESHVKGSYDKPARFIEQVEQDGTAGAVNLAQPHVNGPVLILFVDTLFDADLTVIDRLNDDGVIWVKEVDDYQRFGVVVTDNRGHMTRIVEKPDEPISKLANIGLYYMRDWKLLFEGIESTLAQPKNKGEWYLTDAFQYMIDHGCKIRTAVVDGWYDCGKVDTLLETNHHLLKQDLSLSRAGQNGTNIVPPVRIGERVELESSTIGPNVTIEDGATIKGSELRHVMVGRDARVTNSRVDHSLIGDHTVLSDTTGSRLIAAHDEIIQAP